MVRFDQPERAITRKSFTSALVVFLMGVSVVACDSSTGADPSRDDARSDADNRQGLDTRDLRLAVDDLLDVEGDHEVPEGPIDWPEDSLPQSRFRAESWQVMAFLENAGGARFSVLHQLDRVRLRSSSSDDTPPRQSESAWHYRDVMRGRLHVVGDAAPRQDWQAMQRVALGLAGAEVIDDAPGSATVWVGNLGLDVQTLSSSSDRVDGECPMRWKASLPGELDLTLHQRVCASVTPSGPIRLATSASLPVSGQLKPGQKVTGTAWVRHAFGDLPGSDSPVVFDTALLELDGPGLLMVSRSKRRRGGGPETLSAQWHTPSVGASETRLDDLQWQADWPHQRESTTTDEAAAIPPQWRLRSVSGDLDVRLQPVSRNAWVIDADARRWRGAVSISGSHQGVGFVEIQPVSSPPAP